ncbi:MAG: radical SAM protein [Helicobacteraceae bacterium]|jgi:23S rRNA (adenine2503-C2)-methyltransferase|nr:radical SAM protein [Helicobacteraceae bacterium]
MKNVHGDQISIADIVSDPFSFTYDEISARVGENDAKSLYSRLYKNASAIKARSIWIKNAIKDARTKKYVFELFDSRYIESVCIQRRTGVSACVSVQVGCPVRCIFCESGKNGLIRNLSAGEIVQQIICLKERVNRIVFMGIGEPLFNYDALIKAIHILRDRNGLDFPTDGISISTAGAIKQLKKIREEHIKIQLILSLHATTQKVRDYLMPGMRNEDINETVKAALSYSKRHNRKLVVAYLLLRGINDNASDIKRLSEWFSGENAMINLLEYNQTSGAIAPIDKKRLLRFKDSLQNSGLEATVRDSRGKRINAACGQLASTIHSQENFKQSG